MSNPQQPELARSRKTPHQDQDSVATVVEGRRDVDADAPRGPVPPENQPGHHPDKEQDKPDLDAFAKRLGTGEEPAEPAHLEPSGEPAGTSGTATTPTAAATAVKRSLSARTSAVAACVLAVGLGLMVVQRRRRRRR